MRVAGHWILFALALLATGAATFAGGRSGVIAAFALFAICVALALLERIRDRLPWGAPRMVGWTLVLLQASLVPLIVISGIEGEESSPLVWPGVIGSWLAPFSLLYLSTVGPQPSVKHGRLAPVVIAWLGLAMNLFVSQGR